MEGSKVIKYIDGELANLLGPNYRADPEVQALSYAIKQGMLKVLEYRERALVYANIDSLPDNVLDLLAVELQTQYYDSGYDIEKKRELIKATLLWHAQAGTTGATGELVRRCYGEDSAIHEWYDFGGDPYTFMISTRDGWTPDSIAMFNDMIRNIRNIRSRLTMIALYRDMEIGFKGLQGVHGVKRHALIFSTEVL